jgi:hypothetical protein
LEHVHRLISPFMALLYSFSPSCSIGLGTLLIFSNSADTGLKRGSAGRGTPRSRTWTTRPWRSG